MISRFSTIKNSENPKVSCSKKTNTNGNSSFALAMKAIHKKRKTKETEDQTNSTGTPNRICLTNTFTDPSRNEQSNRIGVTENHIQRIINAVHSAVSRREGMDRNLLRFKTVNLEAVLSGGVNANLTISLASNQLEITISANLKTQEVIKNNLARLKREISKTLRKDVHIEISQLKDSKESSNE